MFFGECVHNSNYSTGRLSRTLRILDAWHQADRIGSHGAVAHCAEQHLESGHIGSPAAAHIYT